MMRAELVRRPIEVAGLLSEIAGEQNGAVSIFLGTVRSRNDGRDVLGIEYTAYDAMAAKEMMAIAAECGEKFSVGDVILEHRLGKLAVGEISVAVVAAHPHRTPAIDAMHYAIEELKRRVPIWKLEQYSDGTSEWVSAASGAVA